MYPILTTIANIMVFFVAYIGEEIDGCCIKRGFEIQPNVSYTSFLGYISRLFNIPCITRLSYKMSVFQDPVDIFDDHDLCFLFKLNEMNPNEVIKLYIQQSGFGSSTVVSSDLKHEEEIDYKIPDLNVPLENSEYSLNTDDKNVFNHESSIVSLKTKTSSSASFYEGYIFKNKEEMKLELGKLSILECFSFKVDRSSNSRYEVSCVSEDCEWRFRAYSNSNSSVFYVKYFNSNHTCSKTQTHPHLRQANPRVIGDILKEQMKDSRRVYRGKEIVQDFRQRFHVDISYSQAWRGKCHALQSLHGSSKESFSELPLYCYNLEKCNPGTVTHIRTDSKHRFEFVFISIGASVSISYLHTCSFNKL